MQGLYKTLACFKSKLLKDQHRATVCLIKDSVKCSGKTMDFESEVSCQGVLRQDTISLATLSVMIGIHHCVSLSLTTDSSGKVISYL